LYLHDVNSRLITKEIVWLQDYLDSPTWHHRDDAILFIRNEMLRGERNYNHLYQVRADGNDLKYIHLKLPQNQ